LREWRIEGDKKWKGKKRVEAVKRVRGDKG
jgi:hypothetical protein